MMIDANLLFGIWIGLGFGVVIGAAFAGWVCWRFVYDQAFDAGLKCGKELHERQAVD